MVQQPPTLASRAAYAQWSRKYPPYPHNPLMRVEQVTVTARTPSVTGKTMLDLACGSGRYGRLALLGGASTVFGIDNSAPMLRVGQRAGIPMHWIEGNSEAIPLPSNTVDVIVCGLALGHLPALEPSLNEVGRVLKYGGIAVVSDFHPDLFTSGARRTFEGEDGRTLAVEHYAHTPVNYQTAAANTGLRLAATDEPKMRINRRLRPAVIVYTFELAG
jgi:malonyl-CoA O-methyltransferase